MGLKDRARQPAAAQACISAAARPAGRVIKIAGMVSDGLMTI